VIKRRSVPRARIRPTAPKPEDCARIEAIARFMVLKAFYHSVFQTPRKRTNIAKEKRILPSRKFGLVFAKRLVVVDSCSIALGPVSDDD
jgi:hypothetical protein